MKKFEDIFEKIVTIIILITIFIGMVLGYITIMMKINESEIIAEKDKIIEHTYGMTFDSYNEYLVFRLDRGE